MGKRSETVTSRAATLKETSEAIIALTDNEVLKLKRIADKRSSVLSIGGGHQNWGDEVLQEAFTKVLSGEKKWPIEKINIMTCLSQAIKNIVGHEVDRVTKSLEGKSVPYDSASHLSTLVDSASQNPLLLVEAERQMETVKIALNDDPLLLELIEYKLAGFDPKEIREGMKLGEKEYNALDIKLKRRITAVLER
ncbi:MAG: hypothetical protein V4596_01885 [Bdellovibrionota bacterium]